MPPSHRRRPACRRQRGQIGVRFSRGGRGNYKDSQSLNVVFTGVFDWGCCSNYVGSGSGQRRSVKFLQNMVYNTTQHPHPLPHSQTLSLYTVRLRWKGGEGVEEVKEKVEGLQFTREVETNMTDCISSLLIY
jgi:hypothetical protein